MGATTAISLTIVPSWVWFGLSSSIYLIGLYGIFRRNQNFLTLLLKIEVMYIGLSMFFFGTGIYLGEPINLSAGLMVLGFAASETALGLSLFFFYYLTEQEKSLEPIFRYNVDVRKYYRKVLRG